MASIKPLLRFFTVKWEAKVLSLVLAVVMFLFFRIQTLQEVDFSIPLEVRIGDSYIVSSEVPRRVHVSLRGRDELVNSILQEELKAYVDLRPYKLETTLRAPIQIERSGNAMTGDVEIRLDPSDLTVAQEEKVTRSMEVRPLLTGFPSSGYELSRYFVSPSSISVSGPRSVMEDLESISTEEIDISGRYEEFTVTTRLVKPHSSLQFPGGEVVEFRGVISEAIIVDQITGVSLVAVQMAPDLVITSPFPNTSITVQGSQIFLAELEEHDIRFIINCGKIDSPGMHTVPVQIRIPEELTVLDFKPKEVILEIKKVEEEEEDS